MATGNRGATASGAHCDRQPSHHTHPRLHVRLRPLRPGRGGRRSIPSQDAARLARVRQLVDVVRADSDEKKRKSAIRELNDADPRVQVEVIPILVAALRKDSSETVRSSAAEAIGRYSVVFPLAGLALEDAAIADRSATVRAAARQAYGNTIYWVIAAPGAMMPSRHRQPSPRSPNQRRPPNHRPASRSLPLMQPPSAE